jgi:hypothetical protein
MQLTIIKNSDSEGIGKIEAQVGMELANGYKVLKVNDKSVVAELDVHQEKFFPITFIYYSEAMRWEFTCSTVDTQTEKLAAIKKKFMRGEKKYKLYYENGYILPLSDRTEQAGYDFAKEMQVQRSLVIAELEKAESKR